VGAQWNADCVWFDLSNSGKSGPTYGDGVARALKLNDLLKTKQRRNVSC